MNRKKAIIVVIAILALLVMVGVVLFMMGRNVPNSQKIGVSNVCIDLGVQSATVNYGILPPSVNYTVENLNNIDVTTVSLSIDGINTGPVPLLVPSGRSVSTSTFLSNDALSELTTYNVEFVFTFADGTYETISTSCTTPESG
jgi:hypothetical protein